MYPRLIACAQSYWRGIDARCRPRRDQELERELGNQAAALVRLLATRPLHNAQEGAKPGQAWPDEKIMGVTLGSESEIQLAVEKVKAVLSVIKKTRSATGAKMAEPKAQAILGTQPVAKLLPPTVRVQLDQLAEVRPHSVGHFLVLVFIEKLVRTSTNVNNRRIRLR
jgi:hypothetical protein